jgi:hypothetical protein
MISACGSKGALYEEEPNIVKKNTVKTSKQVTEKIKKQP